MLNAVRKCVEGVKRRTPSSREKVKIRTTYLCYKALVKKEGGRNIDENDLKGRREFLEIKREEMTKEKAEEKCAEALKNWEDYKKKAKQEREKYLLELHPLEISGDVESIRKKRKQAIKTMEKAKCWQYTFDFLTKNVGKGVKNSLKRVKVVNQHNEVAKKCQDRRAIEHEVSECDVYFLENLVHYILLKIEWQ